MREFAKVGSTLWGSKKFKPLCDRSKLVYLYLLTNRHAASVGCYPIPVDYISADLKTPPEAITEALSDLVSRDLIAYHPDEDLVYIVGWIEWYLPTSPNHCKRMVYDICPLADGDLKNRVATDLLDAMDSKGWTTERDLLKSCISPSEALPKPFRSPDEDLAKGFDSPGEGLTHLTSPNLTSPLPLPLSESSPENLNTFQDGQNVNVSKRDNGQASRKRLYEEFPQISTGDEFANRLPQPWVLCFETFFGGEDHCEGLLYAHAVDFWDRHVGSYPGDEADTQYPEKSNWFMAWEYHIENAWRKLKKLPPKTVKGGLKR